VSAVKIVLCCNTMATYPQAGGHWSVYRQYLHGLAALGHKPFWLELFPRSGLRHDEDLIRYFLDYWGAEGFADRCVVVTYDPHGVQELSHGNVYGISQARLREIIQDADVLWNFHCSMRKPLLQEFRRKALLDLDPGHLQVSSLHWDLDIDEHDIFFTVGLNMGEPDCEAPLVGKSWHAYLPPVHLSLWHDGGLPPPGAPLTSITQWNWGSENELWLGGRLFSPSKRDAYRRFLDLPSRCSVPLELAANIHPDDVTGDREELRKNGWKLVHPRSVAATVADYQIFIRRSLAEIGCAKPLHSDLRTGWFSDRSAAYLASGRPVVIEDTGLRKHINAPAGVLWFRTIDEASGAVDNLLSRYDQHRAASREFAQTELDARKVLSRLVELSA
jgi:hypothetical protein